MSQFDQIKTERDSALKEAHLLREQLAAAQQAIAAKDALIVRMQGSIKTLLSSEYVVGEEIAEAKELLALTPADAQKTLKTVRGALEKLAPIGERILTQDNRCTVSPMFCVQIKVRDVGFDSDYADRRCWHDSANDETIYEDDPGFVEPEGGLWDVFGYRDRWETVMVAFTEAGCEEYLKLNGHNDRRRAHRGEVRIYAESFNRCPEMIEIRETLAKLPAALATLGGGEL